MAIKKKTETITSYKGFDKDLKCRGFQYEIGKTYKHDGDAKACESGFHACEHPLDVLSYYAAGSRYALVEQSGQLSRHGDDTKVSSSKIKIKAEIGIAGLVHAAVEYVNSRCGPVDPESPASATGDQGTASATGYQGAASATGNRGAASATGNQGAASATGNQGAASATGYQGAAMAAGFNSRVMGAKGNALFAVYRKENGSILHAKAAIVGEGGIKDGVWYSLNKHGEFVEV